MHVIHHSHWLGKGDVAGHKPYRWSLLRYWTVTVLLIWSGKLRILSVRQIICNAYVYNGMFFPFQVDICNKW